MYVIILMSDHFVNVGIDFVYVDIYLNIFHFLFYSVCICVYSHDLSHYRYQ